MFCKTIIDNSLLLSLYLFLINGEAYKRSDMNLVNLLEKIEERPLMYVREKSLNLLESYINGYFLCQIENNLINKEDKIFRDEFYYWLKDKFELDYGISWVDLITQISQKENKNDFDLFFNLLKIFKSEKLKI